MTTHSTPTPDVAPLGLADYAVGQFYRQITLIRKGAGVCHRWDAAHPAGTLPALPTIPQLIDAAVQDALNHPGEHPIDITLHLSESSIRMIVEGLNLLAEDHRDQAARLADRCDPMEPHWDDLAQEAQELADLIEDISDGGAATLAPLAPTRTAAEGEAA